MNPDPSARAREVDKRVLIIVDQFEEFLILNEEDEEAVARLRDAFATLADDGGPGLTVLLVFRSDYEELIDALNLPRLHQGVNWKGIGPFAPSQAREFLRKGLPRVDQALLDRLMAGLADIEGTPGRFRPVTLNMAGLALEHEGGRLRKAPEQLIHRFVSDAIREPEIVEVAPYVLEPMITEGGTKRVLQLQDLVAATGMGAATVRGCLRRLGSNNLVRALDEAQDTWEISHDFLAQLIGRNLGRLQPSRWRVAVRWAAPAAIALWTLTLIGAGWYWQVNAVDQAKARLAELKLSFTGKAGELRALGGFGDADLRAAVPSLSVVAEYGQLRSLDLPGTALTDLSPLAGLTALQRLDLSSMEVTDLSPLAGLTSLQTLDLTDTAVTDLSPLAGLTALQTLGLNRTRVADLSPLAGLTALQRLDLTGTEVVDLSPLAGLTALQWLDLFGTRVTDLSPVSHVRDVVGP